GIELTPGWAAMAGCSSMFILARRTAPLVARTAFSMIGLSVRHGPHHGAQKSTRTGCLREASSTSLAKVWVVVSMTRSSPRAAGGSLARTVGALMVAGYPVARGGKLPLLVIGSRGKMARPRGFYNQPAGAAAAKSRISGSWPVARMKATRSLLLTVVVAVLTSGWKLTVSWAMRPASRMTRRGGGRSLTRPNGGPRPGGT